MAYSPTVELAKQLGAIKVVDVSRENETKRVAQYFDYLLVLDFEATCWCFPNGKGRKNEVIEFSVVLYDVNEGRIIDEFQQYVQPTEFPILSEFCTELTGITQKQVDEGVPIGTCLMLFTRWINNHQKNLNISFPCDMVLPGKKKCVFVTWSDWDLGVCLPKECRRKNIYKQEFFGKWVDLREIYMEHYYRRPKGLLGALEEVGLEFIGKQHSGLDDAKNTAYLVRKLIEDGALLRISRMNKKKR
ncbi:ERI1 exoribonuclease 2 [Coccinella septempunctata]|uniref:ERI1 exoribonuclease 2 n=1 Tax=Coccinella septempunctata TaxID=41139 RepID=UPI001D08435D|nr:ERI1 exoribonuclease 2 [Coccinella septempunctata]